MPAAARVTDMHICPATTGAVPHVGGPILPIECSPNILINGLPAAMVGTMAQCIGPPDTIAEGSATVFFNGRPAARMGDMTAHGGRIIIGSPNVFIGDAGAGSSQTEAMTAAAAAGLPFLEECGG